METKNLSQLIESWIHVSPGNHIGRDIKKSSDEAIARANMLGDDTSDPDASGIAVYTESQNLPTALASIMNHVQKRSDFHPSILSAQQLATRFEDFIQEVDNTPFFSLYKNEKSEAKYESKNYNKLIDSIVKLYTGISSSDQELMKDSIVEMGKSVFGKESTEKWKSIFSQSTLDMTNPYEPRIFVYYTNLHMKYEAGKAEVKLQEYYVNKTEYIVLPDLIAANAYKLSKLDQKSVDGWLGESTSREREAARLCFNPQPVQ